MKRIFSTVFLKSKGFVLLFLAALTFLPSTSQAQLSLLWRTWYEDLEFYNAIDIAQTPNQDVFFVGFCRDDIFGQLSDAFIASVNSEGDPRFFHRCHFGVNTFFGEMVVTENNEIIVCGKVDNFDGTEQNGLVAKFNGDGDTTWTFQTEGGDMNVMYDAVSVLIDNEGQISLVGPRLIPGFLAEDAYLASLSPDGENIEYHYFGSDYGQLLEISDHIQRADGTYIILGTIERVREPLLDKSVLLLCLTAEGDTVWNQIYAYGDHDYYTGSLVLEEDGGFYFGVGVRHGTQQTLVFRCDNSGDTLWTRQLWQSDGPISGAGIRRSVPNQIYALYEQNALTPNATQVIAVIDPEGDVLREISLPFIGGDTLHTAFSIGHDGLFLLNGGAFVPQPTTEHAFVSIMRDDSLNPAGSIPPLIPGVFHLTAYPNPFNSSTTFSYSLPHDTIIKLSLFDLLGRESKVIFDGQVTSGTHSISFTATDLPSGIYFAQLKFPSQSLTQKIVLLK